MRIKPTILFVFNFIPSPLFVVYNMVLFLGYALK